MRICIENKNRVTTSLVYNAYAWLPLTDTLRTMDFELTDDEVLHKLLQIAEG